MMAREGGCSNPERSEGRRSTDPIQVESGVTYTWGRYDIFGWEREEKNEKEREGEGEKKIT